MKTNKQPFILPEIIKITPRVFQDERGKFFESFRVSSMQSLGVQENFVQDNFSVSAKNTLRGLHLQLKNQQGKLITVLKGKVFDVAVDARPTSPNFGKWMGFVLDDKTHEQIYIPPGFAHGFCALSDDVIFSYKCTAYYDPESEITIRWDDPDIGIAWPIEHPNLSHKDLAGKRLSTLR